MKETRRDYSDELSDGPDCFSGRFLRWAAAFVVVGWLFYSLNGLF